MRAVDQDGTVLYILVTRHRDKRATKRFFRKMLRHQQRPPLQLVIDKFRSYPAEHREVFPSVTHRTGQYENNRAEVSHQHARALGQMKAILRGSEDNTLATFNSSHRSIKDAIKRAAELEQSLTEPRLHDLERAREALTTAWPFLSEETDVLDELRAKASTLEDLLARETFYKELPAIEQNTKAIDADYDLRVEKALAERIAAYTLALDQLIQTPGWSDVNEEQRHRLAVKFEQGKTRGEDRLPIGQLRADLDACEGRLRAACAEVRRIIDGERVVSVNVGSYFVGGVETEEQLDAALEGIREECGRLIGAGKKVIVQ